MKTVHSSGLRAFCRFYKHELHIGNWTSLISEIPSRPFIMGKRDHITKCISFDRIGIFRATVLRELISVPM